MTGGKGATPYIKLQQELFKIMSSAFKMDKASEILTPVGVAPKWAAIMREKDPNKSHNAAEQLQYVIQLVKTNPQKMKEDFIAFKKANPAKPRGKKGSKKSKKSKK